MGFGLIQEPMEPKQQLMGGVWRLHTSSAVELDFLNRSRAAKTKISAGSARRSTLFSVHAQSRMADEFQVEGGPTSVDIQVDVQYGEG